MNNISQAALIEWAYEKAGLFTQDDFTLPSSMITRVSLDVSYTGPDVTDSLYVIDIGVHYKRMGKTGGEWSAWASVYDIQDFVSAIAWLAAEHAAKFSSFE